MLIVDLSSNQGTVDFARLRRAGVGAVWMKVSEGRTWNDPDWPARANAARRAGLRVGGYHFARPDLNSADVEAAHFAARLGRIGRRDLRPVLDFEHQPASEMWARRFTRTFRRKAGVAAAFYSYPAFIEDMHAKRPVGNGLWLASYGRNDGREHPYQVPAPWRRAIAHQFTSEARLAGVAGRVDLSHAPRLRGVLAHPIVGLL